MHLAYFQEDHHYTKFYKNKGPLARPNSLAFIFHNLRIHRNLTRKALAQKFGVTEEYVSKVEDGLIFPSIKFCLMCGQEFGANPKWVKNKWVNERVDRFSVRLRKRLGLK